MATRDHRITKSQRSPKQNHRDNREQEITEDKPVDKTSREQRSRSGKIAEDKPMNKTSREQRSRMVKSLRINP